jgi:23S rRNA (cytosine1962-C5)-methyltransferase
MATEFPSKSWKDYELLDSGRGEKLERFGKYVLSRPEPKALWDKQMSEEEWMRMSHTTFSPGAGFGKAGKEDSGTWNRLKPMPDQWWIGYASEGGPRFNLRLGLTAFKHVGVFPEQAPNWEYIYKQTTRRIADTNKSQKSSSPEGPQLIRLHRSRIPSREMRRS